MGQPRYYNWQAPNPTAIAALQTVVQDDPVIINGSMAQFSNLGFGPPIVIIPGQSRTVSITSTNNLSTANFEVFGFLNGIPVSEEITGPNNSTVETTQLYDTVTEILVVDDDAVGVEVGIGTTGVLPWNNYNNHATYGALSVQTVVTGGIHYTYEATLFDVQENINPPVFTPFSNMTDDTASAENLLLGPITYSRIRINSSTDGSLQVAMIQQGIN